MRVLTINDTNSNKLLSPFSWKGISKKLNVKGSLCDPDHLVTPLMALWLFWSGYRLESTGIPAPGATKPGTLSNIWPGIDL